MTPDKTFFYQYQFGVHKAGLLPAFGVWKEDNDEGENIMRKIFVIYFVVIVFVSACSPSNRVISPEITPTNAVSTVPPTSIIAATATATQIPPTPTFTPTSTLALPVSRLTPVPSSSEKIDAQNIKELQEIARYYGQINYFAKLTKDQKFLFVLDPDGITKYNYETKELLANISLANSVSDFQISNDGAWMIIDNNWLVDFRSEKGPKRYVLSDLLKFHQQAYSLSPDGSMIAAQRNSCPNLCDHELRIVSTKDFSLLYTSRGQSFEYLPVFSPDGTYLAIAETFIVAQPDVSTKTTGSAASIWKIGDFTRDLAFIYGSHLLFPVLLFQMIMPRLRSHNQILLRFMMYPVETLKLQLMVYVHPAKGR